MKIYLTDYIQLTFASHFPVFLDIGIILFALFILAITLRLAATLAVELSCMALSLTVI